MQHNSWNLGNISFSFPYSLRQRIKATPIPMASASVDHISLCSSPDREFDLKEAYNLACAVQDSHFYEPFMGNWVWKTITLPKIKCFLWQCIHKSIPAREVLSARVLVVPISCPLCNAHIESIIHILHDCPLANEFWDSFLVSIHTSTFYCTNLLDWLQINCTKYHSLVSGIS
ncbi:hypothetical protein SO802_006326 [Lithocarpus litseifolius]|uniref:Reverse transcriptase zinc-binding domain-containing protein n=1 Tax=Lithocarpus litseifolius TaxID=425828 RepID=A0AAW2DNL5_9ROSI